MNTEVYRNTDADVPPVNNFSTTEPHPLQLLAEDRITIHHTFLRHLALCNLTPRRVRIVQQFRASKNTLSTQRVTTH